ncbi:MAG: thermonuclease family protein [Patescibacteria group bacterium]
MFKFSNREFFKVLLVLGVLLLLLAFLLYRTDGIFTDEEDRRDTPPVTQENTIHFSKAPERVGDELWVRGEIDHVYISDNGNYFLNFCSDFRDCPFNGVIFSKYAHLFDDIESWSGQEIYIYGTVGTYEGRPQIIVEKSEQIKVDTEKISEENGTDLAEVVSVIDGDTIWVEIDKEAESVRLIGVDAPELEGPHSMKGCYGPESTAFLEELLSDRSVVLKRGEGVSDRDKYGRLLRFVYTDEGEGVNGLMIEEGYAFVYGTEDFAKMDEFKEMEDEARNSRRGLWGDECEYYFQYQQGGR